MTSFDSHAHFPTASAAEHHAQIARAREAGLCGILAVGGGPELDPGAIAMARECPADVHLALGLDRDVAMTAAPDAATLAASMTSLRGTLARLADEGIPVRAIGEIGLDFSRDPTASVKAAQIALFHPTETVDLFFHVNAVAESFHRRLSHGKINIVAQRQNVN